MSRKRILSLGVPSCTFDEITKDADKIEKAKDLVAQSRGRIISINGNVYYVYNEVLTGV